MQKTLEIKAAILKAGLEQVPFEGWCLEAFRMGAITLGIEKERVDLLFSGGIEELTDDFFKLLDQLWIQSWGQEEIKDMRTHEKVEYLILKRFEVYTPYKEALKSLATYLLKHPLSSTKYLFQTVDLLWYEAGDASTDYNYYTKRGLLSVVYSSTLTYWLNSASADKDSTQIFLKNRLKEVSFLPQISQKIRSFFEGKKNPSPMKSGG